ncbi:TatD family hydrolase [Saccharobesus litoralis]|nr:TatD family hydrolase [Saccharobesus litoralis]
MLPVFDIGVNLTSSQFAKDCPEVIDSALQAGVAGMMVTGTTLAESQAASQIAQQYPNQLFCTAGVHPHYACEFQPEDLDKLRALHALPHVLAVGECGLDFNRDFSPRDVQQAVFEQQIQLAIALGKPIFMHQRDAHDCFMEVIQPYSQQLKSAVVHCFTGTQQEMQDYLDLGFYIGFTGWICDERRGVEVKALTAQVPDNRLLIETDAPYLLPRDLKPKPKSRRNEPKFLPHILTTIADVRGEAPEALAEQIWHNSQKFLQITL